MEIQVDDERLVEFHSSELERHAKPGCFCEAGDYPTYAPQVPVAPPVTEEPARASPAQAALAQASSSVRSGAPAAASPPTVATDEGSGRTDADVVREFLRRVGLPEANTDGSTAEMMMYLRGRLGL